MKILLVHNNQMRWADVFRAEELKKAWVDDEVDITNRFNLPNGDKYDVIHFLYSGAMTKSKDFILKYKHKVFTSSVSKRSLAGTWDDRASLLDIFSQTQGCVCQNKELVSILKGLVPNINAVYIPNGIDEKLFNREFVAGFVGAKDSNDHKGFYLAKQACDELGIKFISAKEWDYEHEQIPEFYKKIDCLIIPSLSEGCNNPTLEALAMNKPVISTRVGIAEELEGVVLVERNVDSIKEALRKLSPRIGILEKYKWSDIAKQYREFYVEKLGIK